MAGNPNIAKAGERTRFQPGQSGNPTGTKPGTKHLSTWIQELMSDENFTCMLRDGLQVKEYKGAPIKAIVGAQIRLAINGDTKAFDALSKYGYGSKQLLGNDPDNPLVPTNQLSEDELNARLKQIVATTESGGKRNPSGTRPKKGKA